MAKKKKDDPIGRFTLRLRTSLRTRVEKDRDKAVAKIRKQPGCENYDRPLNDHMIWLVEAGLVEAGLGRRKS